MEEDNAAGKLKRGLGPDMLDRLAGDIESNKGDDLDDLMRANTKSAVRVGVARRVTVRDLHDSNHQHECDAGNPDEGDPRRTCAQS
jgi:hypothetical protein